MRLLTRLLAVALRFIFSFSPVCHQLAKLITFNLSAYTIGNIKESNVMNKMFYSNNSSTSSITPVKMINSDNYFSVFINF